MTKIPKEYEDLLLEIQRADFVLVELTLYLDTHPYDQQALEQFNHCAHHSKQLKQQFEQLYGPLMQFGESYSAYPWQWSRGPWPWQI
ncbi:spore coat protein CotJB [Thalassobacillus sp. CUG 92003]|uniref:spore coat protein CotJB n=1 Tax=Thalassobacillus sp. CUG 92003 TaxID=2736641 RepID=UPI0015E6381A|nr:spore coat protein CotJB [Thalassobacillus sp. CUG 92003]